MAMKEIEVYGRKLPCRVTMGALLRFKRMTGYEVSEIKDGDLEATIRFLWCCVQSSCNADGVTIDMDFERFADGLEMPEATAVLNEVQSEGRPSKKK